MRSCYLLRTLGFEGCDKATSVSPAISDWPGKKGGRKLGSPGSRPLAGRREDKGTGPTNRWCTHVYTCTGREEAGSGGQQSPVPSEKCCSRDRFSGRSAARLAPCTLRAGGLGPRGPSRAHGLCPARAIHKFSRVARTPPLEWSSLSLPLQPKSQ